jgi:hypothetical protein
VSQNKEPSQDADEAGEQRPNPRRCAIDKDLHQRQHSGDEPVEAQHGRQRHKCRARLSNEHQTNNDSSKALEQKDPPDVRLLRHQRYVAHDRHSHDALAPTSGLRAPLRLQNSGDVKVTTPLKNAGLI